MFRLSKLNQGFVSVFHGASFVMNIRFIPCEASAISMSTSGGGGPYCLSIQATSRPFRDYARSAWQLTITYTASKYNSSVPVSLLPHQNAFF